MSAEISEPNRRNWQLHHRKQKKTYALALFHLNKVEQNSKGVDSRVKIREFSFPVNPSSMELEEPAAVTIKPTQGGGQFVEHQGQIYKDINLTGTTGLRPANNGETFKGVTIDPDTGLYTGERSGFDDLIDLRNLFREYYAAKTDPELAHDVIMVWKNGKEGEYYVVEPITFKTSRDASSPLTFKYLISLKTIKRLEKEAIDRIRDSYLSRNGPQSQRGRFNRYVKGLATWIETLNANYDNALSEFARGVTDIFRPTNDLFRAMSSVVNTTNRVFEIPRSALLTLSYSLSEAINSVSNLILNAVGQPSAYNSIYANIATAYRGIHRIVLAILAEDSLFASNINSSLHTRQMNYVDSVFGSRNTGGDPLAISNEKLASGVAQAVVGAGDNIRKLAKRLLGNASRWKALVIANGLKAPYISADGDGIDVLRPGDRILYPVQSSSRTAVASETSGKNRELSPIEERLGRDIRISSPTSVSGVTTFDFQIGNSGDVELVEGVENMVQAVRIKFETEQGELPLHPFFGIKYPLGVKATAADGFIEFDVNARATLLSDLRIADIGSLNISFAGNTLEVKGGIIVKGFDTDLAFDFSTVR